MSVTVEEILQAAGLTPQDTAPLNIPSMPSFMDLLRDALSGNLDLSPMGLVNSFFQVILGEFIASGGLIRQLVAVAILGAFISVLTAGFKHKGAGETGFYVTFLMAGALAVSSYYIAVGILTRLTDTVASIMQGAVPIMIGLMAMGGNFLGAAGFNAIFFFVLHFLTWFITNMFVPLILGSAALEIAGKLSEDGAKLNMLAALVRKIADWTLKGTLALFAGLLTLQRVAAPISSNLLLRTSRNMVGAVPVVGNAFTAAVDTVVTFSQAARSGVLVALVLILCGAMAGPLIKIFVIGFVYKVVAAFLQPVADSRLVGLMDIMGRHLNMLFFAGAIIGVACIYGVVIMLSF